MNDVAPPSDLGWASYGIGWMSYLHSPGHGLWSQLFAVAAFFPCLVASRQFVMAGSASVSPLVSTSGNQASSAHAVELTLLLRASTLLSVVLLCNLFYGYMAAASVAGVVLVPALQWRGRGHFTSPWQTWKVVLKRALRFGIVLAIAAVASAYFVAPFLVRAMAVHCTTMQCPRMKSWPFDVEY